MMFKRFGCLIITISIALVLSGCSVGLDVETLLRPPHATGEQQKIQKALEKYFNNEHRNDAPDVLGGYVLKYPMSGEYRSAFVLKDLDGDGQEEAIVFYRYGNENSNIHLNLLKKNRNEWESVSDMEGASTDIDRIQFGDLDSDGNLEVFTGWNINNVREKQLVLYSVKDASFNEWYKDLYTEFIVGDLTDSGRDSIMVLHINTAEKVTTAKLLEMGKDKETGAPSLAELGSARLDGYIQQFLTPKITRLTKTQNGISVDGIRSADEMVTELIYWDGTKLCAPYYNSEKNASQQTLRKAAIPSMDVDGDGAVEWPAVESLKGYTKSKEDRIWMTRWNSWSIETQKIEEDLSCVINITDGYYLLINKEWKDLFTLAYEKKTHTLTFLNLKNGVPDSKFMMLRTVYQSEISNSAAVTSEAESSAVSYSRIEMQELERFEGVKYMVWFSDEKPYGLKMDYIRYMFTYLQ